PIGNIGNPSRESTPEGKSLNLKLNPQPWRELNPMADERSLSDVADRTAVSDVVLTFARSLDLKDWESCRRCFLDQIETDYSDLRGEPPSKVAADDFVAKRRVVLEHLQTLHLSTNHQVTVEGDTATCVSAAVIHRHRAEDGERFDTYCTYTHTL